MKKCLMGIMVVAFCVSSIPCIAEVLVEEFIDVPVVEDPGAIPEQTPEDKDDGSADQVQEDKVSFLNGDRLKGMLVSVDPKKGGLTWQSPYSAKPIDLELSAADKVELKSRSDDSRKWGSASILLSNDDELWGDIVSLDKSKMILKTWYAGTMEIHRPMIARIMIQNKDSSMLYDGPNSMAEWTVGRHGRDKSWEFKKGALYALQQYPIARKIKDMPDKVKIEFDMSWRGSYPGIAISFFNDNLSNQSDCYAITISGSSIYLYRYSRNSGSSHLGNADVRSLTEGGKSGGRFTILADRNDKKVALLIDGAMVRQWDDKAGGQHDGDVVMFYPQNQNGTKLSRIKITEWDGRVPQAVSTESTEKTTEDLIRLGNGDKVSGEILSISDGALKFKASYADMDIPLTRIVEIISAEDKRERARRNQFDVKFSLVNGGGITFDLKNIQSDEAAGASENFGAVTLPLSAVKEIECNLYADKPESDELEF